MPKGDLGKQGAIFLVAAIVAVFRSIAPSDDAEALGTVSAWSSQGVWDSWMGHRAFLATHLWVHVRTCCGFVSKIAQV